MGRGGVGRGREKDVLYKRKQNCLVLLVRLQKVDWPSAANKTF